MQNITDEMKTYLDDTGTLPAYAWPGGYPLYYLDSENNALCPPCANDNDDYSAPIAAGGINWADPAMYCDHCSKRIESAYAEDAR